MNSERTEYRLDEITELIVDCPHSTPKWTDEGTIVLRNQNIRNGRLNLEKPSFTNEEGYQSRIKRAVPKENDIVLTREAPMGEVCIVPSNLKCCLGQRMVLIRPQEQIVDSKYLLFAFQGPNLKHQISWNEGTGTTVSNIRIPNIKGFRFNLPPLKEQKRIAHILGTLDDKIELNRKMNETLEAMAQALFKSWFVDFDPVIDNALTAGNPIPESLQKKADKRKGAEKGKFNHLFPSSFTFNEALNKWIPEGWEVKSLDQIANYQNGLALQKFRPVGETDEFLPVLKIAHLKEDKTDGKEKARVDIKEECRVYNGDIIFSWSASLMVKVWTGGNAALNQHLFKVTSKEYPKWFYYLYTNHHLEEFIRIANDKAVTMGHIKREHLKEAFCLIPSKELFELGNIQISKLIGKKIETALNTKSLMQTRDTILPKLISGKIKVYE